MSEKVYAIIWPVLEITSLNYRFERSIFDTSNESKFLIFKQHVMGETPAALLKTNVESERETAIEIKTAILV